MRVTEVHSFSLKMHQKSFGGRAPLGPARRAYSVPQTSWLDLGLGRREERRQEGRVERGGEGEEREGREGKGREVAPTAICKSRRHAVT